MEQDVRQKLDSAHKARVEGDYEEAERLYREALEQVDDPIEEAEVRDGLGCTLIFTGMFDEGLAELATAHEKNPDDPKIFLELAKTHLMLGTIEEAQPQLEEIIERFPDTPEAEEAKKQLSYFQ